MECLRWFPGRSQSEHSSWHFCTKPLRVLSSQERKPEFVYRFCRKALDHLRISTLATCSWRCEYTGSRYRRSENTSSSCQRGAQGKSVTLEIWRRSVTAVVEVIHDSQQVPVDLTVHYFLWVVQQFNTSHTVKHHLSCLFVPAVTFGPALISSTWSSFNAPYFMCSLGVCCSSFQPVPLLSIFGAVTLRLVDFGFFYSGFEHRCITSLSYYQTARLFFFLSQRCENQCFFGRG